MIAQSRCRSCSAPVVWVILTTGKRAPLDATPVVGGNVEWPGLPNRARVMGKAEADAHRAAGDVAYTNHFATCPDAKDWKRP